MTEVGARTTSHLFQAHLGKELFNRAQAGGDSEIRFAAVSYNAQLDLVWCMFPLACNTSRLKCTPFVAWIEDA